MEGRELRLGNIVNFLEGSSWLQGRVNNINESKCVIGTRSIKTLNIQGIGITDEWLIKFGFREMEDTGEGYPIFYPPQGNKFQLYYSESNHKFNCDVLDFSGRILVHGIVAIDHVHQLQNLFFMLTGEELTV